MEILIICAIIIYCVYVEYKYRKSDYYKSTHLSWHQVKFNKGRLGEYRLYSALKYLDARFLFNVYIPYKDGYTEIDCIMLCKNGIFVFESKNFSGWIFGNDSNYYWHQTLYSKYDGVIKERFYNPVLQNESHIIALKNNLGDRVTSKVDFFSFIVFSDRCDFKELYINKDNVYVIHRFELNNIIDNISSENCLDSIQIEWLYNKLFPFTQLSDVEKELHLNNVINK